MTSSQAMGQALRLADRHVQRIDFAAAIGILHLPHPLFARNEDFHGVLGGILRGEKQLARPTRT